MKEEIEALLDKHKKGDIDYDTLKSCLLDAIIELVEAIESDVSCYHQDYVLKLIDETLDELRN